LRPVDVSNCVYGPHWGSLQRSPDPLAGFGEGNREGGWKGLGREKERKEKEMNNNNN